MKKILTAILASALALSLTACDKNNASGDSQGSGSGSGVSSTEPAQSGIVINDSEVNRNPDIDMLSEKLSLDGKEVAFGDISIDWLQSNGFVMTSDADTDPNHELRSFGTESFGFVKKGSEESLEAVLVTLTYMNQKDAPAPFSGATLVNVAVELGDESTQKMFSDVSVSAPYGLVPGAKYEDLESKLGQPSGTVKPDRYTYTTYDWLAGEGVTIHARVGENVGLYFFELSMN